MNIAIRSIHTKLYQGITTIIEGRNPIFFQLIQNIWCVVNFSPISNDQVTRDFLSYFPNLKKVFCYLLFWSFKHALATMRGRDNGSHPLPVGFRQESLAFLSRLGTIIYIKDNVRMNINHFICPPTRLE